MPSKAEQDKMRIYKHSKKIAASSNIECGRTVELQLRYLMLFLLFHRGGSIATIVN